MLVRPNGQPISFDNYKRRMKALEDEQIELISALEKTTANLEQDAIIITKLRKALNKYMTYAEIDNLLNADQNPPELGTKT